MLFIDRFEILMSFFEVICEWSDAENTSDRVVVVTFTVVATLYWIISDIISRIIAWIIFWMFWFERFCCFCLVISASLEENEIMKWNDFLWFIKVLKWRFLRFCNMISEISSRGLSDNKIFLNDSAKFWAEKLESSAEFVKQSTDDFVKFFEKSIDDFVIFLISTDFFFLLFLLKKFLISSFEIFLNSLNDIFINLLVDSLFLEEIFEVIDRVDCDVLDVLKISSAEKDLNCS